ncbi:hypothetical protein VARIO8X_90350 [Burkholderiales bacterium 8X]|nr:hypothetical protein VARIO8X_90350 [Burkholderiales bacterium 8X]
MISDLNNPDGLSDKFFAGYQQAFPDWFDAASRAASVKELKSRLANASSVDDMRRILNLYVSVQICEEYVPFVNSAQLEGQVDEFNKFIQPLKTELKLISTEPERSALIARTGEQMLGHFRDIYRHRYNAFQLERVSPAIGNYLEKIKFNHSSLGVGLLRDSSDPDCRQIMEILAREFEGFALMFVRTAEREICNLQTSKRIHDADELATMPAAKFDVFLKIARNGLQIMKRYPIDDLAQEIVYRLFDGLQMASTAALKNGMSPGEASSLLLKFKRVAVCAVYFNGVVRLLGQLASEDRKDDGNASEGSDDHRKQLAFVVQAFGVGLANAAANGHRRIGESSSYADKLRCVHWPSKFVSKLDLELGNYATYLDDSIQAIESRRY